MQISNTKKLKLANFWKAKKKKLDQSFFVFDQNFPFCTFRINFFNLPKSSLNFSLRKVMVYNFKLQINLIYLWFDAAKI
jgi:hypothetical protein